MWKRLYKRFMTDKGLELVRPPKDQIDAALNRVEGELNIRLPASYSAFIHEFGPGEIGGYFRIYGPPIPGFADYGNDILEETRSWKDPRGAWAEIGDPQLVARLVCFSSTIGGDACFWDPEDVRNKRSHEYGIYVRNRDSSGDEVKEAASSFKEFVERHCLANEFHKIVGGHGWDYQEDDEDEEDNGERVKGLPPQRFYPAWETKKTARP